MSKQRTKLLVTLVLAINLNKIAKIIEASRFGQTGFGFLGELDARTGRYVDNANFFSVPDPEAVPDDELYDLLMGEYPGWVKAAGPRMIRARPPIRNSW